MDVDENSEQRARFSNCNSELHEANLTPKTGKIASGDNTPNFESSQTLINK